jgi:hypothetical protein
MKKIHDMASLRAEVDALRSKIKEVDDQIAFFTK